jgi:hypothetical protein
MTTTEDAFGTPAVARGSMMNVAGKTDAEMDPDEELLVDEGDDTTMKGSVYPEGKQLLRMLISEIIRKSGSGYVLMTKHKKNGKRRKLGTHKSKASAERQERAIHAHGG